MKKQTISLIKYTYKNKGSFHNGDDGNKVSKELLKVFEAGLNVELDVNGVNSYTSEAWFNAVNPVIEKFGLENFKNRIKFRRNFKNFSSEIYLEDVVLYCWRTFSNKKPNVFEDTKYSKRKKY